MPFQEARSALRVHCRASRCVDTTFRIGLSNHLKDLEINNVTFKTRPSNSDAGGQAHRRTANRRQDRDSVLAVHVPWKDQRQAQLTRRSTH